RGREVRERNPIAFGCREPQVLERDRAPRAPHLIDRLVRGDLVEPRPRIARARRRPTPECREKGLLVEIVSVCPAPGQTQRVREDFALVALQKLAKCHPSDLTTNE